MLGHEIERQGHLITRAYSCYKKGLYFLSRGDVGGEVVLLLWEGERGLSSSESLPLTLREPEEDGDRDREEVLDEDLNPEEDWER